MPLPPIEIDGPIALQKPLVSNHESGLIQTLGAHAQISATRRDA
jgi:hypothetical protein